MNVPSRLLKPAPVSGRNHQPGPRAHNDHDNEANTPTYPPPDRRSPHALTACTIVSRTVPAADEPITFASFLPDVTKAGVVESAGDMTEFAVWGRHTAAGADPTAIFNGERIYRDGIPGSPWTYDVPRFWVEGHYDFYALHPYETALNQSVSASADNFKIESYDASAPDSDGSVRDLMLAVTADKEYDGLTDPGEVPFTFHHLLCMIEFVVTNPSSTMTEPSVTSASLYGMYRKWDFMADKAFGTSSDVPQTIAAGWKNGSEQTTSADPYCKAENLSVTSNSVKNLFGNIMMVPQTVTDVLVFSISYQDNTGSHELTIPLSTAGVTSWSAGKKYRYTLTVNTPGDADLNITVNDWEIIKDGEDGYDVNDYLIHW